KVDYYQKDYMFEFMQRYKNWINEHRDSPFTDSKVINPNFQFAITQRLGTPQNLDLKTVFSQMNYIFFMFYYYLDFLAIEFLGMDMFVKSLFERITEDQAFKKIFDLPTEKPQ